MRIAKVRLSQLGRLFRSQEHHHAPVILITEEALMKTIFAAVAIVSCAACASQADTSSQGESVSQTTSASSAAIDVIRAGGTFGFALDESDPAARIHASCNEEGAGDEAKSEGCYARIAAVAKTEGIRFTLDDRGRVVWTSYGENEKGEEAYIRVPITLTAENGRFVRGAAAESAEGTRVPPNLAAKTLPFEVLDANTIVMNDPRKGRLVFHRR